MYQFDSSYQWTSSAPSDSQVISLPFQQEALDCESVDKLAVEQGVIPLLSLSENFCHF